MHAAPSPPNLIGSRLRRWRRANFITQRRVAQILHLHREAVSELEAGRRKLTFAEANTLRVRLGLAWTDLTRS